MKCKKEIPLRGMTEDQVNHSKHLCSICGPETLLRIRNKLQLNVERRQKFNLIKHFNDGRTETFIKLAMNEFVLKMWMIAMEKNHEDGDTDFWFEKSS